MSKAEWKGSATDHFHVGALKVTGNLSTTDPTVTGGQFTIPVISIQDFDLKDSIRQVLLTDLKSANFFNIAIHPNAAFKITKITPYNGPRIIDRDRSDSRKITDTTIHTSFLTVHTLSCMI